MPKMFGIIEAILVIGYNEIEEDHGCSNPQGVKAL